MNQQEAQSKLLHMRVQKFVTDSNVILAVAQVLTDGNRLVSELVQVVNDQAALIQRLQDENKAKDGLES